MARRELDLPVAQMQSTRLLGVLKAGWVGKVGRQTNDRSRLALDVGMHPFVVGGLSRRGFASAVVVVVVPTQA